MDKETLKEIVTGLITYGWMIALAMLGGLVAFIRRLNQSKEPKPLKEIFMRLFGELIIDDNIVSTKLIDPSLTINMNQNNTGLRLFDVTWGIGNNWFVGLCKRVNFKLL